MTAAGDWPQPTGPAPSEAEALPAGEPPDGKRGEPSTLTLV